MRNDENVMYRKNEPMISICRGYNFIIRLGEWNSATNVEPYIDASPSAISIHPNFNAQNLHNDIAVVRLSKNIATSSYANINTACLPTHIPAAGTRYPLKKLLFVPFPYLRYLNVITIM